MAKKIVIILLVLALTLALIVGCADKKEKENDVTLILPEGDEVFTITHQDLGLPQKVFEDMGLFIYQNGSYKNCFDQVDFDVNKPTVCFTHGMGSGGKGFDLDDLIAEDTNYYEHSEKYWVEKGYNVLSFDWGPFANDAPTFIQGKIWGRNGVGKLRYTFNGSDYYNDFDSYSVAEMYSTYLLTFFRSKNYDGSIHLMGHSMGAMLSMATAHHLLTLCENGEISKRYLPERVTLFDTFIMDVADNTDVAWLDRTVGEYGSAEMLGYAGEELTQKGVAVEYMRTGIADFGRDTRLSGSYLNFWNNVYMLDYNDVYMSSYYSGVDQISAIHEIGHGIFSAMFSTAPQRDIQSGLLGFGPHTPSTLALAKRGYMLSMEENLTALVDDDVQFTAPTDDSIIAGIVFHDFKESGKAEGSMLHRIQGVKVTLYQNGNKIDEVETSLGGAYRFVLPEGGDNFKIVFQIGNYKITKLSSISEGDFYYLKDNNMQNNYAEFSIKSGETKFFNLGITA